MNFIFFSLLDRRPLGLLGCRQCFRPPSHHFSPCSGPWQRHHQVRPSWRKLCLLHCWGTRIRRHHSRCPTRPYPGRSLSPRCCHSLLRLPVCWLPICRPIRRSRCRRCQSWSTSFGCINKIFQDVPRLILLIECSYTHETWKSKWFVKHLSTKSLNIFKTCSQISSFHLPFNIVEEDIWII